jgi:DNA-directed RNA polymerase subunit K/omega
MERPKSPIDAHRAQGMNVVMNIDTQGAQSVKKVFPDSVLVFVSPPSWDVLEKRLRGRKQDDETTIQRRLANARAEMDQAPRLRLFGGERRHRNGRGRFAGHRAGRTSSIKRLNLDLFKRRIPKVTKKEKNEVLTPELPINLDAPLSQLLLTITHDKYRMISLVTRWAKEIKQRDQSNLQPQELLAQSLREILGKKVTLDAIEKLPPPSESGKEGFGIHFPHHQPERNPGR